MHDKNSTVGSNNGVVAQRDVAEYVALEEEFGRPFYNFLQSQLHQRDAKFHSIFDLGCGGGRLIELLSMEAQELWGIDSDKNKIDIAQLRFSSSDKHVNIIHEDVESLIASTTERLPKNHFDLAVATFSLHYFDSDRLVDAVHRFLRPGGLFLVIGLCEGYDPSIFGTTVDAQQPVVAPELAITQTHSWKTGAGQFYELWRLYEARSRRHVILEPFETIISRWTQLFEPIDLRKLFPGVYHGYFLKKDTALRAARPLH